MIRQGVGHAGELPAVIVELFGVGGGGGGDDFELPPLMAVFADGVVELGSLSPQRRLRVGVWGSSVVASQIDRHARFGGVVPEIASRAHVELLTPVIAQALVEAGLADDEVEVVAATTGPGLIGALLVGLSAAKALALVWDVPFV